ncbi:MAG: 16S rRNA (adenine(1518)-N(6)/adenine(1519)-N(6))-dimethyltransferase RsmA [Planctomycetota bacterium]
MKPEHVQTKSEIQQYLEAAGMRPRKRFGQHFLIDGNLMRRLVQLADLEERDTVIEVGPGTGGLTDLLVGKVSRLICVEIDRDLHALISSRYADRAGVRVILGDALAGKHEINAELVDELDRAAGEDRPVKLVANLPYQAATPLVMNLLVDYPQVVRLCFSVQAEVGMRMMAKPGGRDYGPLSIICQWLARVEVATRVPPEAFWPRPAVDSVLMNLVAKDAAKPGCTTAREFALMVRSIFEHRVLDRADLHPSRTR